MQLRRLIAIVGFIVIVTLVTCAALTSFWQGQQPVLKDAPKLIAAVQAFSHEKAARGQLLPATVSLRELVSGGYIAAKEVQAFDGMEVTISLATDKTRAAEVLIRVRLPDGSEIAQLTDGSIQQRAK